MDFIHQRSIRQSRLFPSAESDSKARAFKSVACSPSDFLRSRCKEQRTRNHGSHARMHLVGGLYTGIWLKASNRDGTKLSPRQCTGFRCRSRCSAMKLNSLQRVRRLELQKAAYEVARKQGFHSITVEQIARHAGTSKGIVHHYFKNKKQLIEHAVRYSHLVYRKAIVSRLKKAKTPSERLWSIIDGTFDPDQFGPEI